MEQLVKYCTNCKDTLDSPKHQKCLKKYKKYIASSKGKDTKRKYRVSSEGKENTKKYRTSLKGKETKKSYNRRYNTSPRGRDSQKRYRESPKGKEAKKKHYAKCVQNNKCSRHPLEDAIIIGRCLDCWYGLMALRALGSSKERIKIKEKFDFQEGKCIYSGRKLIPGINASIDHLIPKKRGGGRTLDNVCWVDLEINKFIKNWKTAENLLDLCEATWKRWKAGNLILLDKTNKSLIEIWEYQLSKK